MINEIFQSLHESVKKRNKAEDFLPLKGNKKEVIHRGYIRKTGIPIKYDMIPDGSYPNSGKHVYFLKDKNKNAIIEIDHQIHEPTSEGRESKSFVRFHSSGIPKEDMINVYRSFIVPSILHHENSHKPDKITLDNTVINSDDIIRRLGKHFETTDNKTAKRKIDIKLARVLKKVKKNLNTIIRGK